jgi:hypothetical protein
MRKTVPYLVIPLLALALLAVGPASLPASAQTPATARLMRQKLALSQRLLEAILTSNFATLDEQSAALARLTESPSWTVFKTPEYRRYSEAFVRATDALRSAAKDRDLDAAALDYTTLAMSCYQCHRYIKNARIADGGGTTGQDSASNHGTGR